MRTLVTGGAGFIGSHLVEHLLGDGHEVLCMDNFSSGSLANLAHVKGHKKLSIVEADATDFKAINKYFIDIDWVFHLAGIADIVPSIERPAEYHCNNASGTASVLEASRLANVKRFIYAASSSCYGIPKIFPTPESADIRPQYPYALSKYLGELSVLHWSQVYGLPAISLRLFNVYGLRSRTSGAYGAVFGVFLAQKAVGKPFTVVGDGNQTRDFVYVTDVAKAFVRAAESDVTGEVFNIGSGNTYSINHLTGLLEGPVINVPKRPGEPDSTHADIARARAALFWGPEVPFEEGVKTMLRNIQCWKKAPVWEQRDIERATKNWFEYLSC